MISFPLPGNSSNLFHRFGMIADVLIVGRACDQYGRRFVVFDPCAKFSPFLFLNKNLKVFENNCNNL